MSTHPQEDQPKTPPAPSWLLARRLITVISLLCVLASPFYVAKDTRETWHSIWHDEKERQTEYNRKMHAAMHGQLDKLSELRPLALLDVYVTSQEENDCRWTFLCSQKNPDAAAAGTAPSTTHTVVSVKPPSTTAASPSRDLQAVKVPGQTLQQSNASLSISPEAMRQIEIDASRHPAEIITPSPATEKNHSGLSPETEKNLDNANLEVPFYAQVMKDAGAPAQPVAQTPNPNTPKWIVAIDRWLKALPQPLPRLPALFGIANPGVPVPKSSTVRGTPHAVFAMASAIWAKGWLATLMFVSCAVIWIYISAVVISLCKRYKFYVFFMLLLIAPITIDMLVSGVQSVGVFTLDRVGWVLSLAALLMTHALSILALLVGFRHIVKTPTELREVWESVRHLFSFRMP